MRIFLVFRPFYWNATIFYDMDLISTKLIRIDSARM